MQETQETRVRSLGWEDPLEKEMAIHSSTLAWKIPWTEEPSRLQSMGSQRVGYDQATSLSLSRHHKTPRREHRQNILDIIHTSVFLGQAPKAIEIKNKNKQMGPNQMYKLLHSKGNHKQNEKTTYRMGENICK